MFNNWKVVGLQKNLNLGILISLNTIVEYLKRIERLNRTIIEYLERVIDYLGRALCDQLIETYENYFRRIVIN